MKYITSFFILTLVIFGIYFLGEKLVNFKKIVQHQSVKISSGSLPVRTNNDVYYFNDSKIKGADHYAQFELKRTREELKYDFCMVLRPKLPPNETIESYAIKVFEEWKIGADYDGKGVLFLFIEDIKELKIEVSYELEDVYPDSYCASFQHEVKMYMSGGYHGDVFGALLHSMMRRNQGEILNGYAGKCLARGGMSQSFLSGGAGVTTRDFYRDIKKRVDKAMDYEHEKILAKYPVGKTPIESIQSFLKALHDGVDYPFLPMITKGSQLMRLEYPHPPSKLTRIWGEYNRAAPMYIMEDGDLAAVRFDGNNGYFYLRQAQNGDWLIDFVKTWAYQGSLANGNKWWLVTREHPWMFAYRNTYARSQHYRTPELRPTEEDPYERIYQLQENVRQNPNDPEAYFALGEYLYFECYWIRAAIMTMEKGIRLDPENVGRRFMVIDMRQKFPMWDQIGNHYEAIIKHKPKLKDGWTRYIRFANTYINDKPLEEDVRRRSPYHK